MHRTSSKSGGLKAKKSYTLSPESVAFLETLRKRKRATSTSSVLEEIIQTYRMGQRRKAVDAAITEYYSSLDTEQADELAAWGKFALDQFPDKKARRAQ